VGAGLLAKAVYQGQIGWLTHRIREQARSHICFSIVFTICFQPRTNLLPNAPAWRNATLL